MKLMGGSTKLGDLDGTLRSLKPGESSVALRAQRIADTPLSALLPADVAFCLRQRLALPYVFPVALGLLEVDPLALVEGYRGDLLLACISAAPALLTPGTEPHNEFLDICLHASAAISSLGRDVLPDIEQFVQSQGCDA